ncbi:MAG: thioredoxin family protein [Acidobacteriota bacterium]
MSSDRLRPFFDLVTSRYLFVLVALTTLALTSGCASTTTVERKPPSLLGDVVREQIEAAEPEWVSAQVESGAQAEPAAALADVEPAEVTVYFGTWCGDSRRELARFWKALDETGGLVPFTVRYIAVDRYDERPPELEDEVGLRWVPTFIVERSGEELGRIVESAPEGIEIDMLALLTGDASGTVSAREDMGGDGEIHP